jgi:VanZ family protein
MAVIFTASSIPGHDLPEFGAFNFSVKKGGHVCGYLALGVAFLRALVPQGRPSWAVAVATVLLCGLYAVTDEVHQSFVPGRTPSATDVLIDMTGASLGVAWRRWHTGRGGRTGSLSRA